MSMKLKKQAGCFELWADGTFRSIVLVASGTDATNRVTVSLFHATGVEALATAKRLFDSLVAGYQKVLN